MEEVVFQYKKMAIGEENNNLNFDDDDEEDGEFDTAEKGAKFPVMGIFLTDQKINFQALKDLLASIWRPSKRVSIKEIGAKRYLFTFYRIVDMNRVLEDGLSLF
ncbi:unnamed protein product [Cuscuta epithymum]|uniref:DUF4283 domain-containing protein n=1 Tax=Cuscuta epithymum TaxID=186058 RepID=A0AAV0EHP0_9ASTE|nr:unnamed protein product [Cuscuta epithymum]